MVFPIRIISIEHREMKVFFLNTGTTDNLRS
jgi:hypothetical protein